MRIYISTCSRAYLRRARVAAPSNVIGQCWTPQRAGFADVPYIVDNGVYGAAMRGETWDEQQWLDMLDRVVETPYQPDFGVLPDVYNDAQKTHERHLRWIDELRQRDIPAAFVLQPGLPVSQQVERAADCDVKFAFVGGDNQWKRAMGTKIVQEATDHGLTVHIGNPGGKDGLQWCSRIGAQSADTSTICQNQYWHYLESLERRQATNNSTETDVQLTVSEVL